MWRDSIVEEIRRNRQVYAARFQHDIKAICRAAREQQQKSSHKIVSLLQELWCDIDSALKNLKQEIPDFPNKDVNASNISEKTIKKYIKKKEGSLLLYYGDSTEVHLGVQLDRSNSCYNIYFGVFCDKTAMPNRYKKLKKALHDALNGRYDKEWPWWRYADEDLCFDPPNRKTLKLLSDEEERKKFANEIADGLKEIWDQMKEAGLT